VGLAGVVLIAAGLAAYANSLGGPFVFDDVSSITDNPTIRHLWPLGPVLSPPPGGFTVSGRPILNLSFALNYAISGASVASYHVGNLVIHLLGALTLFGILRRTPPRSLGLAFSVALLWLVHPLQTEAVDYIVQRAESLMGLFYLLTVYAFIRYAEPAAVAEAGPADDEDYDPYARPPRRGWGRPGWAAISVAACLLGMGTKEVMVSAPLMVFCYDRTFVAGTFRAAWRARRGFYLALGATWIVLALLVFSTGGDRGGTSGFDVGVEWWAYGLTQFEAVVRYLALACWPRPLVFEYGPFHVKGVAEVAPAAAGVLVLAGATAVALRKWPAWGFLGLWFFAILAPTSLVPGTLQMISEHRMYLPLAAVVTAAVIVADRVGGRRFTVVAVLVAAAGLGFLTFRRNGVYRSTLSLWADTVAKRPDNPYAQYGLGVVRAEAGQTAEAIRRYERALALKPDYAAARLNLGNLYLQSNRVAEAMALFQEQLRLTPRSAVAHNNYGSALADTGQNLEAMKHFQDALRLKTYYPEAEYNLGNVLAALGQGEDAIAHYQRALQLRPDYVEARAGLGVAYARAGRLEEAIGQFEAALRLRPAFPEELFNLGKAMAQAGRWADAIGDYEEALRLEPGYAEAHNALGGALAAVGRYPEARTQLEEALQFRPGFPEAAANLERLQKAMAGAAPR
jgi:tetratricopeptide (TPR) repeat protein